MLRTLIFIPHEIASIPVFGVGWALGVLALVVVLRLAFASYENRQYLNSGNQNEKKYVGAPPPIGEVVASEGLIWAVAAAVIVFVLPNVELRDYLDRPVGMAIRGYGVMMLCGVVSAVALAYVRAKRMGLDPEWVLGLAPWLLMGGIAGARLFYVIQYRQEFYAESMFATIKNMMAFTTGGLVVYGSFIGGFVVYLIFVYRHKIPMLRFADVIIPCVFIGVFFGRIGCLMNGCCYGGRCEEGFTSIQFPANTEIYREQLRDGELLGMSIDPNGGRIQSIVDGSIADDLEIQVGQTYQNGQLIPNPNMDAMDNVPVEDVLPGWSFRVDGTTYALAPSDLPEFALPVRAAQLISSFSSLILCLFLCTLTIFVRRPGALMCIGFASYAVVRFGLEWVRVDEAGQFNTSLSISQWVSVIVFTLSIAGLVWIYFSPREQSMELEPTGIPADGGT